MSSPTQPPPSDSLSETVFKKFTEVLVWQYVSIGASYRPGGFFVSSFGDSWCLDALTPDIRQHALIVLRETSKQV